MQRRTVLKISSSVGALAAIGGIAAPAISQRAASRALRFVPQADLSNFDPIWTTSDVVRNASALVWDRLYGLDAKLQLQRQMVEAEEVSADGLAWTFRLRPGLKFHDGEPVLAKDVVASLSCWSARDSMGVRIGAIQDELAATDDQTFRWRLKRPFPKMMLALGKMPAPFSCIMPARIAATDPFRQITEYIGSGPMRSIRSEWVPGARAAFERFPDYVPRPEPASWLAGGKRMLVDRIEWKVIADPATAAAALQSGEVDWWEYPIPDLIPVLRKNRNVAVDIADPLGSIGGIRMNHLHPPFNDAPARRAVLMAVNQEDFMRAFLDDDSLWKPMHGVFTPGTPLYNDEGGEVLKGRGDIESAKRLLAESGYSGQPVTCLVAQDLPFLKAWGDVLMDLLKRLGMRVDFVATDWGTVVARRAQKTPPREGGWNVFVVWFPGGAYMDPTANAIRANGEEAWFGWPNSPQVEAEVSAWLNAKTADDEQAIARRLNRAALDHVVYAPLGFFVRHQAWRRNVTGIVPGPLPFFWGVSKSA
jgi:peptide/nickel transport system substrate-binding protein